MSLNRNDGSSVGTLVLSRASCDGSRTVLWTVRSESERVVVKIMNISMPKYNIIEGRYVQDSVSSPPAK